MSHCHMPHSFSFDMLTKSNFINSPELWSLFFTKTDQFPEKTLSTLKSTKVFSELTLSIWNSVFHLYFWLKLLLSALGSGHTRAKLMTEATRSGLFGLFFLAFLSFRANSASKLGQMAQKPARNRKNKRSEKIDWSYFEIQQSSI